MKGFLAGLALTLLSAGVAWAEGPQFTDPATTAWFKSLEAPDNGFQWLCCDQADCMRAASDYRTPDAIEQDGRLVQPDGQWWAHSNRVDQWVPIDPKFITRDKDKHVVYSIFPQAILCEGTPETTVPEGGGVPVIRPRVYCFSPPPTGF
jgi:hypothetical protein